MDLATEYAVRLTESQSMEELRMIWAEINSDRIRLPGFYQWLADIKDGQKLRLSEFNDDHLTKEGKNALNNRP